MSAVSTLIAKFKEWDRPRRPIENGKAGPFRLQCVFSDNPADSSEIARYNWDSGLAEFWSYASSAQLFKDVDYGQWGLEILSPADVLAETRRQVEARQADFKSTDLTIGCFLGDSDLLVLDTSQCSADGCHVLVALPLYGRSDWPKVANSFVGFLEGFLLTQGEKYWEAHTFRAPA